MQGGSGSASYLSGTAAVKVTESPGKIVYQKGESCIDASNASLGYITVKQGGLSNRLKLQVIKDDKTYNYDLNNQGNYEAFPLQMGSGTYTVRIMKNLSGSKYAQVFSASIDVALMDEFTTYLYPNQYVNYTATSEAVQKSFELCAGQETDLDKVKAVYNFLINNITYDKNLAVTVESGYLPDVDAVLKAKKGICFDYAALMAAMLRAQNIPSKLVVGKVAPNGITHAWNEIYIKNVGWITVGIKANGSSWERMDATFGASKSSDIEKYIGTGSNYTALRVY